MGTTWIPESAPYFAATLKDGDVHISGQERFALGQQVDIGGGRQPGGAWVRWQWDGSALTVLNDRFRAYPLYYFGGEQAIAVSPSIDALLGLGADRSLDLDAVATFLAIGHFVGEDTAFTAIRTLPPSARLRWDRDGLHITSDPPSWPARSGSRQDAVVASAELVRNAVQRTIPSDPAFLMPISGGRDSRHLLLELLDNGHRPTRCLTAHHHPHVWGGDVPYAARLCRELGVDHEVVTPGPLIRAEWAKNRLTGYCADEHAWYLSVAAALNGRTSHTYDGLNGSTVFALEKYSPKLRKLNDEGRFADLAAYLGRKQRGKARYLPLLAPDVRDELAVTRARGRITRELERHADKPEPYLAFRFWSRTVRELNLTATVMLHGVPGAYFPFLDPDVVAYMWSVPSEHIDDAFHDDVIRLRFPKAHGIPYRERTRPQPGRAFLREVNRGMLDILRRHSDGTLVDRAALMRRAAVGAVTGDRWFAEMRRGALVTWLVQLESIVAGRGPNPVDGR